MWGLQLRNPVGLQVRRVSLQPFLLYIYTHTNRVWNTVTGVKVCVMNAE